MKSSLLSNQFIIPTLVIAFVYIILVTYAMNSQLTIDTITGGFSFQYKINLLSALLQGMWTSMNGFNVAILFLIAILTGANLTLLWGSLRLMKKIKDLHIVVGGNSLIGIIGSGCAACGLPILSLLGIGGSILYLPFHGAELSYLAAILLSISFYLLLRSNQQQACVVIPAKKRVR